MAKQWDGIEQASSAAVAQGMPPALVDVAKAEIAEVALARRFVGTIRPRRISVVGSETGGLRCYGGGGQK